MSTVGETLAAERRRQGKTLADVEAGTKIMGRMLDAIEHGRYDELPSPVYVKGYLQSYAKFLGMDEKPVLEAYKKEVSLADTTTERMRLPDRAVVQHRDQIHSVPLRTWLYVVGAVVVLGLVLWAISGLTGGDDVPTTIPPTTTSTPETTATTSPGETTTTAETTPVTGSTTTAQDFTVAVTVEEGSASWLRVTIDGLNAYEGTLTGPQTKEWTVADSAMIVIGKPDVVKVTRDGTEVPIETADGRGSVTLSTSDE